MSKQNAIAVFDIGKTNKKLLVFNEEYKVIFECSLQFDEIKDEDEFPCEDVVALTEWIKNSVNDVLTLQDVEIRAINFSAYGASFVHVDEKGNPVAPLYNYLKPFPEKLKGQFYAEYGGEINFSKTTASPVLGNLNSGLQLYRLKYEQPDLFNKIHHSLHLPQYLSSILTKKYYSDITSIGCHTALWDFTQRKYHQWVHKENIIDKFADISSCNHSEKFYWKNKSLQIGIGMHDSSAALVPYLLSFKEPFVLLSTGTWNISLNPFNDEPLTTDELKHDCLCYITHENKPVKASRLFAGHEYELQVKRIAEHFNQENEKYSSLNLNDYLVEQIQRNDSYGLETFSQRNLADFADDEHAYYQLISDSINAQIFSTGLILSKEVNTIFVDGGFSKNTIFMHYLTKAFPGQKIFAASVAQASALGAAMVIHDKWNEKNIPGNVIHLKNYSA
ncbi:MAG: carbohydrate kinase [Bacteroidetes bacterium]|nr:carbohydrate kinase [Bacteroidota bacterium]